MSSSNSYSYIIDNIYVGDIFSSNCQSLLNDIDCVVSLVDNVIKHPNIDYLSIPIEDIPEVNIIPICQNVYDYIEKNNEKKILIHCLAGGSRSVSMVMYYIMKKYNKSFCETYDLILSKHPNVNINNGFASQLKSVTITRL
jgi:protein-tyrosine phosphatase